MTELLKSQIWCDEIQSDGFHLIVTIDDAEYLITQSEWDKLMNTGSVEL